VDKPDLPDMTKEENEAFANLNNPIIREEDREDIVLRCIEYQIRCAMQEYHGQSYLGV